MIVGLIQKKIKIIIKMIISEKNQIQISIIIMHGIKRINLIIITTITIEIIIVRKITIISNKEKNNFTKLHNKNLNNKNNNYQNQSSNFNELNNYSNDNNNNNDDDPWANKNFKNNKNNNNNNSHNKKKKFTRNQIKYFL